MALIFSFVCLLFCCLAMAQAGWWLPIITCCVCFVFCQMGWLKGPDDK